jgi:hypothetical protein
VERDLDCKIVRNARSPASVCGRKRNIKMHILRPACCLLLISGLATAKQQKTYGFVGDSATAIKIARSELIHVYGKKQIQSEEPLTTELNDGVWTVWGTLWCSDGKGDRTNVCLGGVATITIRQSDGQILSIGHTK